MSDGLAGKTALITGASRGIGRATAFSLAEAGCNVVLASRKQDSLEVVAREISERYPEVGVLPKAAHVGEADQAQECVAAAVDRFGGIDVLVNNAGTNPYLGPLVDADLPRVHKTIQVNQLAVLLWTQCVWRTSLRQRGGAIVNIASIAAKTTLPNLGVYSSTKAAVIALTEKFAGELAPTTRVNAIAAGIVRTRLSSTALGVDQEQRIAEKMPLGRLGEPEDIARAVRFLAGDDSSWITGTTLNVDGGMLIQPVDTD